MRNNRFLATAIACVVVVIGLALGFFVGKVREAERKEKVFSFHGMEITLTDDFEQLYLEGEEHKDTVGFRFSDLLIIAVEEKFTMYPELEENTVDAFSRLSMEMSEKDPALLKYDHGLTYAEGDLGDGYGMLVYYVDADGYWTIAFCCSNDNVSKYRSQFIEWAQTVTFSE